MAELSFEERTRVQERLYLARNRNEVQRAVNDGGDVNLALASSKNRVYTPFQYHCDRGNTEQVKAMIDNGADLERAVSTAGLVWGGKDESHMRPLDLALRRTSLDDLEKRTQTVQTLLDAGAETAAVDRKNPILLTALQGDYPASVFQSALEHGANPNEQTRPDQPPVLHHVTDQHDPAILDLLLDYGARQDVNVHGRTPQFMAAFRGDINVVDRMVERGGDPAGVDVMDRKGNTPLSLHLRNDDPAIAERLLNHGADPARAKATPAWQIVSGMVPEATPVMQMIHTNYETEALRRVAEQAMGGDEQSEAPRRQRARL